MEEGKREGYQDTNLAQSPKLTKIILGNGKEYKLAPMNANILCSVEDEFDKSIDELLGSGRLSVIRYLIYLRLKDKYPEFDSEEKVGELLDIESMKNLGESLGVN